MDQIQGFKEVGNGVGDPYNSINLSLYQKSKASP